MQIKIEKVESKNVLNYYLPQTLLPDTVLIVQKASTCNDELTDRILDISGVMRCMIADNTVSVQYSPTAFEEIKALVMAEIDDFVADNRQLTIPPQNSISLKEQAEAVADAFIRPTLNRDKGDIELHTVTDGVLELSFTGHCAGCPYAQNTLQNVVIRTFRRYIPQIKDVRLKG